MKNKQAASLSTIAEPLSLMPIQDAMKVARNLAIQHLGSEDPENKTVGQAMAAILEHVSQLEMTIEKFRIGLNQSQMAERDCPSFGLVGVFSQKRPA